MFAKMILTVLVLFVSATSLGLNDESFETVETTATAAQETTVDSDDYDSEMIYTLADIAILESDGFAEAYLNQEAEKIENLLMNLYNHSDFDLMYVYFGGNDGTFYMYPQEQLPEDYDFRERPVYKSALADSVYISEPYEDAMSGREIVTVAVTVYGNDEVQGVLGFDLFIN